MDPIRIDRSKERRGATALTVFLALLTIGLLTALALGATAGIAAAVTLALVFVVMALLLARSWRQLARPARITIGSDVVAVELPGVFSHEQRIPRASLRRVQLGKSAWEHLHRPPQGSFVREQGLIKSAERPNCLIEFDPPVRLDALRPLVFRNRGLHYTDFPQPGDPCSRLWFAVEDPRGTYDALAAARIPCRWVA